MDSCEAATLDAEDAATVEQVEENGENFRAQILEGVAVVSESVDADDTETGLGIAS